MIYSFLSDEAFAVTEAQGSVMTVTDIQKYGLGVIDDNLLNYFSSHAVITDPVGSSKASNRSARLIVDDYTKKVENYVGTISGSFLNFDKSKIDDETTSEYRAIQSLTIDPLNDNIEEKAQRRAALFNIIETIFFSRDDDSTLKTTEEINAILTNDQSSESTYAGYVAGSLVLSTTTTLGSYRFKTRVNNEDKIISSDNLPFYDFCSFKFKYGSGVNDVVEIKIWLSVAQFKANYPFSTITDIVYPCKPEWILNPASYGSEVRAILQAADYKDNVLDDAVTKRDHSGLVVYKTRYVHSSVSYDAMMGFVVMYKGAVPSSEAMREAIKTKLLNEKNKQTGSILATEQEWKRVLPDLFVDSGFYIFPCYYQRVKYGNNTIERSISNYKTLYTRLRKFLNSQFTDVEVFQNMEILQAPGHGMYLIAFPISLTTNKFTSVLSIHPTYQPLDSVGSVTEFIPTRDTSFQFKNYFCKNSATNYEFIPLIQDADYRVGESIADFVATPGNPTTVYERQYVIERDDWNTMTSMTKAFAWSLAQCVAACIDETINPVEAGFTVEELGTGNLKRKFYSFVSNSTEYHVMTLTGAEDIFTGIVTDED